MKNFKDVNLRKYDSNGKRLMEHETLLSFNNDGGNYAFNDWWYEIGSKLLNKWCLESDKYKGEATK